MCDVCADFLHLLTTHETRISNNELKHQHLQKNEVDIAFAYIQTWPQRQCMCCYRDVKNFERFNLIVQSIICLTISQLKNIKAILEESQTNNNNADESGGGGEAKEAKGDAQEVKPASPAPPVATGSKSKDLSSTWSLPELERVLIVISKAFLLNFPLYVAYKHGVHSRLDDISAQDANSLSIFCDLHDNEIPAFLLRNVSVFCNCGGFAAMAHCFEQPNLPVSTAHAITATISNVKLWLNYRSTAQLFVPLRVKVLQYMCKLNDQDLRSPATKSMAEFMWAAVKDPLDSQITFDMEGLTLAFKYFTSTTLTMRLSGMAQINAHINLFNDICTSDTVAEVEVVGQKLGDWLTDNQIVSHLFGPNLHVEVIKQSHIVLNFLAVENQITEEHISLIWQAAQLKHCSKPIYDILPSLVKNLAARPALHLYQLLCRLDPKEHTEQSIYIASALTKLIWSRESCRQSSVDSFFGGSSVAGSSGATGSALMRNVAAVASSSENSVSIEGSNSEEEQQEEDSSEGRKSPIEVEGSDSGAPPCKQARHKNCCGETTDESTKVEADVADDVECDKGIPPTLTIMGQRISILPDGSSSDDGLDGSENFSVMRKRLRKRRKMRVLSKKQMQQIAEMSDGESHSDGAVVGNDSDCSETHLPSAVLSHLHSDGSFIGAISEGQLMDLLSGAENDGSYSSPMSNKSEKNMADFDDEDSPCEEELEQLASRGHCLTAFTLPRSRTIASVLGKSEKAAKSGGEKASQESANSSSSSTATQAPYKVIDVCQPGNTLLWDLLQDDKIGQLGESLALEAEKALGTLLCFNTDKFIRMKFVEGCLMSLANNKSVIVCLRLLPKMFASFQQFRATDTHQVTMWAERQHKMMHHFFNNLKYYAVSTKTQNQGQILNQSGGLMYSHLTQVQVRLQFLTSVFSSMGSPEPFRLSLEQVDALWAWLANDTECSDCLFAWLQTQAKGSGDQHALGIDTLQHLYIRKLPELRPEGISMVALGLFQQLCSLARLAAHYDTGSDMSLDIVGMSHLWKIALRANNTDVSLAAIQYINSYYMGQQLKLEKEFVAQCMNHLTQAAEDLNNVERQEHALMCVQRALMLLNTHLETFRRRYAYHLRRWALEGKGIAAHSALRSEGPGPPIRIILQPAGVPDKSVLHLHSTDLVADLKAEVAKWWESIQSGVKTSGATAPVLGLLLSEGPLRIITQGQEITAEYDERSLADVGFKDNQMVYVSLGGRSSGRRRDPGDHPSLQPPPPKECLPTVLLLQPKYFEQLFKLMQTLGDMKTLGKGGNRQPHTKAQLLSRRVWDILAMLPTSPTLLENFKNIMHQKAAKTDEEMETEVPEKPSMMNVEDLLDPRNLQKFMYSLHIVESLCKTKFTAGKLAEKAPVKAQAIKASNPQKIMSKLSVKVVANRKASGGEKGETDVTLCNTPMELEEQGSGGGDNASNCVENAEVDESESKQMEIGETENSSSADTENQPPLDPNKVKKIITSEITISWSTIFVKCGGLRKLYDILMSGVLQPDESCGDDFNEWRHDCLASLLRILCLLGMEEMKPDDTPLTIPKLNEHMLPLMSVRPTLKRLSSILNDSSLPLNPHHFKTGIWGRAQVIHFTMNLLVCFVHSSPQAREQLWSDPDNCTWLQRLILNDPEPAVRREACAGLYRVCLGNAKTFYEITAPLLSKLINFLPIAEKMICQNQNVSLATDEGKEPYGPACRDYFWLLCRLVDTMTTEMMKEGLDTPHTSAIDIENLCRQVSKSILDREFLEVRHGHQDDGLVGLINLLASLIKFDPPFKQSADGQEFIERIFECLFDLPSADNRQKPKCKSQSARAQAYDLLVEMCKNSSKNYALLHGKLMEQHKSGPHSSYPWDYWPREDGRSECGYVGLTNLGATCYMASCIQHLYMMPQAREAVLSVPPQNALKHANTLHELQRMFAYLMESERKSYNPRSFCRVYQMDHQPLNTGEQKDMAEFFIDLVSKLEEMTPDLKSLIKNLFCGVLSNNVVSLDCGHVSRTLEEFYTVRCQVADMRNLHESLDEVTVKDTLEGDNMYTCSQCGKKVRAEKRACFKKLPQILCFNTMRYTFNMVTMLKEKVNTHFSFPMRLDMSGYSEKSLMPQYYQEEKKKMQLRRSSSRSSNNTESPEASEKMKKDCSPSSSTESSAETVEASEKSSQEMDEDEDEFIDHFEYDLVGVTVHTGTADGGHYYSFIKERSTSGLGDRWFLFNDAEVKIFDPSQIAAECFGGEMTSKTYDSVTEKYLDFSFEKTNSAYMLFYERRTDRDEKDAMGSSESGPSCANESSLSGSNNNNNTSSRNNNSSNMGASMLEAIPRSLSKESSEGASASANETDPSSDLLIKPNLNRTNCDIEAKGNLVASSIASTSKASASGRRSLLSKELEDWIWQDNKHFLQDRNIFEHTYFSFMWQICGHIPQTLLMQGDITCIAAQLSVSFFIETFIHAKEKPTMVLWVELLTKQFNANPEACEWFLTHMSQVPWWPVQVLIQCPNQMVRQMFQRLVIHVIQRLRMSHSLLYLKIETNDEGKEEIGNASCVTRFIKSLIMLMESSAKAHMRNLSEFFGLLYDFSRMGEEEALFLLRINIIRNVADFYLGHKTQDCIDTGSDNDDNSSDETLSVDKTRPASLDKMIALVASLVERSRGPDLRLHLAPRDYHAIAGGKGFPFLYQQIKDNINPHQTRHLIHALCRFDDRLANQIISMLFTAVTKHTELCGPFFKLLTLLTENSVGPSGMPCFSQLVLQRVWDAAEYCPQSALDWLAVQAPRNKIAHSWILQSAEQWVEPFLLAHNNSRVRNAAAYLLVCLVPSQSFRANYRVSSHHKLMLHGQQKEFSGEAQLIAHNILNLLLRLLRQARNYTEIGSHGTAKLTAYFTLMTYLMVSKTEKLMLGSHIRALWDLFHPRLSEPGVPAHHNKQALLAFWHHATTECPENAQIVVNCPEITRNIAFNYILADHDESEIVAYNRAMLPAYYGLLRMFCQQSRTLTRQLAAHQNLQWAFKNITPHPTQYAMAVEELFRLMTLFAQRHPDASESDQREISNFRRTTLTAYLTGLDARVSWGTLIAALRILVDNDEDRLFVVLHGGIAMAFEALHTLHSMYHEATACHVSGDLQELLAELVLLVSTLRLTNRNDPKKRLQPGVLKGLQEGVRRLATLLNTFNPPEMRNLAMEVLKELVKNSTVEVINILVPLLTHCHTASQNSTHPLSQLGYYFPRRGSTKSSWQSISKSAPRPPRPMVQMSVPQTQLVQKGTDKEFDAALEAFYKPYHDFLDVMFRMAVNTNQMNESIVNLSCLAGTEGTALHFNFFPKFWVGVYNNKQTNKYVELLTNNPFLTEYIDMILRDERISLNDPIILSFMEIYYPKITSRLTIPRLLDSIGVIILSKDNVYDLCGDIMTIRVIVESTSDLPQWIQKQLRSALLEVKLRFKDDIVVHEDESPPKRRKISENEADAAVVSSSEEVTQTSVKESQQPESAEAASVQKSPAEPSSSTSSGEAVEMVDVSGDKEQPAAESPDKSGSTVETESPQTSQSGSTERKERQRYIKKIDENIDLALKCLPEVSEVSSEGGSAKALEGEGKGEESTKKDDTEVSEKSKKE
ncbi:ubiquitin carboxyl-terminal hydrolase puf [Phlebotomus argentipes]|uniref:ubiquitin carboxyl-terminal hydrolase puf n=1 Tax=Phlebotomus argentipes TaxID=94469 RepID=UPI002892A546|nr:ubiquitin carboxyl-terminal hydrolase puf [Phlebotomus argentipes]